MTSPPIGLVLELLGLDGHEPKRVKGQEGVWTAYCPVHNSQERDLVISADFPEGLTCNGGCRPSDVFDALGFES